jgi:hypothetical protein
MVLNIELSIRGCQVEVPTPMANAIKTGNFRANSLLVAHPFSIFNVPYIDASSLPSCNNTELDLLQFEGEGIPKEMVRKLAEHKFKHPDTTHHLRHQFNNWYGLMRICFGDKSLLAKEATAWIPHVDKHETSYNACFKSDQDFGAKLLGLIDLTFFQLCDSCLCASEIEEVDYSAISLHNKQFDILQNCFQVNKPAYLTLSPKKNRDTDDDGDSENAKGGKKKSKTQKEDKEKFQYRDLGQVIRNPTPVQDGKSQASSINKYLQKKQFLLPPLSMPQGCQHAISGTLKGFVMKNVTGRQLTNRLTQHPTNQHMISG